MHCSFNLSNKSKMLRSSISLLVFVVALGNAALLPEYFTKCSLSDPKLNKCLTKNMVEAWPLLVKGDKNVHLQSLDPLYVSFIHTEINNELTGNMTNLIISGLADAKIDEIKLDHDKKILDLHFMVPNFLFGGQYDIKGSIINIPLDGEGNVNDIFKNMDIHYQIQYELVEKKGEHYIELIKNVLDYNVTSIHFHLDNAGEMVNQVLNENWEAVNKEMYDAFKNVIGSIFTEVLKYFFKKVSFEELFD